MAELHLQSVITRIGIVSHQIELAREGWIGRFVNILPHQLSARGSYIGNGDNIALSERRLHGRVPFVRSGQDMIGVYNREIRNRWRGGKGRRRGIGRGERKRSIGDPLLLNVGEGARAIRYSRISQIVKD